MGKNIKYLAVAAALIISLLAVSCATTADSRSLTGVWDSKENEFSCRMTFTADGYYAYEEYYEGTLTYLDFGKYEAEYPEEKPDGMEDEYYEEDPYLYITLGNSYMEYRWDGAHLVIDLWGNPTVFSRTSKSAKNNSTAADLAGVWTHDGAIAGFTKGGFAISMSYGGDTGNYKVLAADEERDVPEIVIDGDEMRFLIINNRLFLDDSGFVGTWEKTILERSTKGGEDQTTRDILVRVSPWHLTDIDYGTSHYIYNFNADGSYSMQYYTDYDDSRSTSYGSFTYSDHRIELSDDADLAYAIIDNTPFMFTH